MELGPSQIGAALVRLRRRVEGTCLRCGKPFVGSIRRRFCSSTCASAYWQHTHRDRVNASRRRRRARNATPPPPEHLQ